MNHKYSNNEQHRIFVLRTAKRLIDSLFYFYYEG